MGEGLTAPPSLVCPDAHPTLLLRCPAPRPSLSTHPSSTRVATCSQPVVPSPLPIRQLPPPELKVKRPRDRAGAPAGAVPVERGPLRPRTPRPVRPHPHGCLPRKTWRLAPGPSRPRNQWEKSHPSPWPQHASHAHSALAPFLSIAVAPRPAWMPMPLQGPWPGGCRWPQRPGPLGAV